MLASLRQEVLQANLDLASSGLARFTFGNASAISREDGLVAIKPSGVRYVDMSADDLVITDLDGKVVEGTLRPSSDLATHLVLYRALSTIGGVVHTHSHYATVFAQAHRPIPCLGTTHADYFRGAVPVTRPLAEREIVTAYEENTGHAIVRCLGDADPLHMPAALVAGHASFCWGPTVGAAVHTAEALEEIAKMAFHTLALGDRGELPEMIREKHFLRKHGPDRYYGQRDAR